MSESRKAGQEKVRTMTDIKSRKIEMTSFALHVMAMVFMLCDHLWGTIVPGNDWLTCIGRLTFPLYAFMTVEGFFHTKDLKKYVKRMLIFAALSEIPFNLVMGGTLIYPFHQNVLWTFLIGILLMWRNEKARRTGKLWRRMLTGAASVCLAYILGLLIFVDYNHYGVLMVLVFYFFRGQKWWNYLGQLAGMYYINFEMMSGQVYEFELLGRAVAFPQQGFAILALLPIWLYRGKQGPYNKVIKYVYYGFYPVHLLILGVLAMLL